MRSLDITTENPTTSATRFRKNAGCVDNQPYGRADEAIDTLAFDNFA
jgi:hypothetical protein